MNITLVICKNSRINYHNIKILAIISPSQEIRVEKSYYDIYELSPKNQTVQRYKL